MKLPQLGYKRKTFISLVLEAGESKTQAAAGPASGEDSLSGLQTVVFSLGSHGEEQRERKQASHEGTNPVHEGPAA